MDNIIVGLDIGTTKVCAVVAGTDENGRINILGVGRAPSEGMMRGVVTHIEKTISSIRTAVEKAEAQSGVSIKSVIVGIAGDHIQSIQSRGVVAITGPDHEVTQADIDRLLEDTKRVALPSDRKIIHVIPQEFIIDGQDGVYDPLGMSGVRMEATCLPRSVTQTAQPGQWSGCCTPPNTPDIPLNSSLMTLIIRWNSSPTASTP